MQNLLGSLVNWECRPAHCTPQLPSISPPAVQVVCCCRADAEQLISKVEDAKELASLASFRYIDGINGFFSPPPSCVAACARIWVAGGPPERCVLC